MAAWRGTNQCPGYPNQDPPLADLLWATAGMTHTTSQFHIDSQGHGTMLDSVAGYKYWVLARPKKGTKGTFGDTSSMWAFLGGWDAATEGSDKYDMEAV